MRKALIVGIDHYSGIASLSGCVNDATAVKTVLLRASGADQHAKEVPGGGAGVFTSLFIEHERRSHWHRYLHEQCRSGGDGSLTTPAALVTRCTTHMSTPYAQLPATVKDSDREQVQRYLPVIADALAGE